MRNEYLQTLLWGELEKNSTQLENLRSVLKNGQAFPGRIGISILSELLRSIFCINYFIFIFIFSTIYLFDPKLLKWA